MIYFTGISRIPAVGLERLPIIRRIFHLLWPYRSSTAFSCDIAVLSLVYMTIITTFLFTLKYSSENLKR